METGMHALEHLSVPMRIINEIFPFFFSLDSLIW